MSNNYGSKIDLFASKFLLEVDFVYSSRSSSLGKMIGQDDNRNEKYLEIYVAAYSTKETTGNAVNCLDKSTKL